MASSKGPGRNDSYRTDGPFVILTTNGKSTDREREMLFAALRGPTLADIVALGDAKHIEVTHRGVGRIRAR